jgi:hypothetical protein
MLLATTILLLVFRLPSAIISVLWLISAKAFINEKPPFLLRKSHSIANLSATLNAATTFIMFIIYGTKFRSEFMMVYCRCLKKDKSERTSNGNQHELNIKGILPNDVDANGDGCHQQFDPSTISRPIPSRRQANARHSSTATVSTTTTSMGSLPSLRRFRHQRRHPRYSLDREYDMISQHHMNRNSVNLHQQYELTIREDECQYPDNENETASYSSWFRKLVTCQ